MKSERPAGRQKTTKERILDSAEHLFAWNGFRGTSLRAITGGAGVNLAAVNYHFGTKEALLEAVLERRLIPLNQKRRENLERVRKDARRQRRKPLVHDLVLAIIKPTLDFLTSVPRAEDFTAIVTRSFLDPDPTVRRIFLRQVKPVFELIFAGFGEALPELSEKVLLWRLYFLFGAFSQAMYLCISRYDEDLIEIPLDSDAETITAAFLPFITAGMESPEI